MMKTKVVAARKQPSQGRSLDTVKVILEAAAEILENAGFEGYNTNAVAARAGVSIGSLYQYFPNKDALTVALIEQETASLLSDVRLARLAVDARAVLVAIVDAAVVHQTRRPALARLLDIEEGRLPVAERNQRVADRIHEALLPCIAGYPATDIYGADMVVHDLHAILRGIVNAAGERREEVSPATLSARVQRAVFGYLGHLGRS